MAPLLLHSIATFGDLVDRALDLIGARRVVEVGAEGGTFTAQLADWAEHADAHVIALDPVPSDRLRVLAGRRERLELVEAPSPDALDRVGACDAFVLDGDHNYAVVTGELRALRERLVDPERPALAVLHDVGWPCARRDFYYAPERLAPDDRHEHSFVEGIAPGEPGYVEHGLRGAGALAIAAREGGERNGVLTAVEDLRREHPGLAFQRVPAVFGLGFLYAEAAPWAEALHALLAPFDENPLLAAMEENRIELYLHVLRLQDELDERAARHARVVRDLQGELARLREPG